MVNGNGCCLFLGYIYYYVSAGTVFNTNIAIFIDFHFWLMETKNYYLKYYLSI